MKKYKIKRTDEEIIEALIKAKGIISDTANLLGLESVSSLRERIKNNPELQKVRMEQMELLKDSAEAVIQNSIIVDKNVETAKWFMKSIGRDRGYGDAIAINASVAVQPVDLSKLTGEELVQLENILRKTTDSNSGTS